MTMMMISGVKPFTSLKASPVHFKGSANSDAQLRDLLTDLDRRFQNLTQRYVTSTGDAGVYQIKVGEGKTYTFNAQQPDVYSLVASGKPPATLSINLKARTPHLNYKKGTTELSSITLWNECRAFFESLKAQCEQFSPPPKNKKLDF